MKGFKSFADDTILNFEEGFNTIVGANGSGKSNVFDAMCFVLGRISSKGLRADKLGNLVFNGGKTNKPSKEAEVAIYLSNDDRELLNVDLDEIKVSRIVSKKGVSNYYLNNNKSTRTEIVDVLRNAGINPDGYNVILQGDIQRVVNMTSNERRELIEEIANISNYETKRQASLRKLEKVEDDLRNADLLLDEKTKYIRELKGEKEQAEKFHKVKDDLRFNSLLLVKSKLVRNNQLKEKKAEELVKNEEELSVHREKLDELEGKERDIDNEITELEKSIEIKSHQEFIEVTNKITSLEVEIQNLKEKKSETQKQTEEVKTRIVGIKETIKKNNDEIKNFDLKIQETNIKKKEIERKISEIDSELLKLKSKVSGDSFKKFDEVDEKLDELNEKKYNKNQIRQDNAIQVEKLNAKIESLEENLQKVEISANQNKDQASALEKARKRLKEIIIEISKISSNNSEIAAKVGSLQKEYSELVEKHSKLRMKTESSKDLLSTNKAVETISNMKSRDSSIHGTVAELASVPEKYSMALETVAGKNLFNVVVDTDSTAVKYINYLKEKRIGNCTFLPLNKVNAKFRLDSSVLNKSGVIDYALNLINFDRQYENIFHLVFGDTLVIDRIESAKNIGIGDYKMITLDGDLVTKSGAMSGGFKNRSRGLGAFKDDDSIQKLDDLTNRLNTVKNSLDLIREEKEDSERKIYDLRQERVELEGDISKYEKILSIDGIDTTSIKREIENIIGDRAVIEGSLKKIDRDIKLIDEEISELQKLKASLKDNNTGTNSVMSQITSLEEKKDKLKEELMNVNSAIGTCNIQIMNVLKPEIENLNKILVDSNNSLENMRNIISDLSDKIKVLEEDLKVNKAREKEVSKDFEEFKNKREDLKEKKKKIQRKYELEFERFDKVKEKIAQLNYVINEFNSLNRTLDDELEVLYSTIKSEFIELNENGEEVGHEKIDDLINCVNDSIQNKNIDVKELQNKVNNLKTKMNSFGSINMKAVEVYDKLKEEFDILIEKRKNLNLEKDDILELVAEMDEKKKEKFLETFKELEENFVRIFNNLSTKGEVELIVEDEKDIFNNGVDIRVRLTQKNYLDIKSLSGGEKTITALAFIFAVQEFNPASFYIFDEVDAALDIMNSEKLGKLIRQYSVNAQYIVVSHSEHLIQSAQSIYGVTMDKYKVSGCVSLDLRDMKDYIDEEVIVSENK